MSASLVGSEMCIRDSCGSGGRGCQARTGSAHSASNRRNHGWSGRSPVSYTHLTLPTICSV
eukprot:4153074-Alexandrium_andersonii.AAC.1